MSNTVTPTCRYGHGELTKNPDSWSLGGIEVLARSTGGDAENPISAVAQNGRVFTLNFYRCAVCGYIELFDDVADNE